MATFPLSNLPRRLAELTGSAIPNGRKLYAHVVDGVLPAEQVNGRWYIAEADLPQIVEALGLTLARPAKRTPQAKAPVSPPVQGKRAARHAAA